MWNTIVDRLNHSAVNWLSWLAGTYWDATIMLIVVSAIWLLVRRHAPAQLGYLLFLLVPLKLFIPLEITVPGRVTSWLPISHPWAAVSQFVTIATPLQPEPAEHANASPTINNQEYIAPPADRVPQSAQPTSQPAASTSKMSLTAYLMLSWSVLLLALLLRFSSNQLRFHRALLRAKSLELGSLGIRFQELLDRAGIRSPVCIVESDAVASPSVWGIIRPCLIVPPGFVGALTETQLKWVMLHELAHIRRRDLLVSLFQRIAGIVHILNPAVWIANRMVDRCREFACDDFASTSTRISPLESGEAFMAVMRFAQPRRQIRTTAALGVFNSPTRASHVQRMERLIDTERSVRMNLGAGSLSLLLVAAAIGVFQAQAANLGESEAASQNNDAAPNSTASKKPDNETNENKIPDSVDDIVPTLRVVIAQHVILLDGKSIVTWPEIDELIASIPDPSRIRPQFYFTSGARKSGNDKPAKEEFHRLYKKYKFRGGSEGSLSPRVDILYDRIQTPEDLIPDESLRVEGKVVDLDGQQVVGAEVFLVQAVDESVGYKTYHLTLVQGRVRNPLEYDMTHSDGTGGFVVYPPKVNNYYVAVIHPTAGFALVPSEQFTRDSTVKVRPWAGITTKFWAEPETEQNANLKTQVKASGEKPEISIDQYWVDMKVQEQPPLVFSFAQVPPHLETTIYRDFKIEDGGSISLPNASVWLEASETRRIDFGQLSDQQRERLHEMQRESAIRRQQRSPDKTK